MWGGGGVTSSPPNAAAHFSPRAMFTSRHLPPSLPLSRSWCFFLMRDVSNAENREKEEGGVLEQISLRRGVHL